MADFVHLHNHSDFSLLDAAQTVDTMCNRVYDLKMDSIAITEHGNLFSMIPFYKKARETGIKPIIGCEIYVAVNKHTDKKYVRELANRTAGEGMKNVLILVDINNELDSKDAKQRSRSVEEHKAWVDCASQLGCAAIRVNCRSGGNREENLLNAVEGMRSICDYAQSSKVKVVIEPHGGHSSDPDWLLAVMKKLNHPSAGILPDFNNFGRFDRYDGVRRTLPYAPAVCAKALNFDNKGIETHTDFFRMMKIIYKSEFSGVISIEFEGHDLNPIAGSLKTKALLQKAFDAMTE